MERKNSAFMPSQLLPLQIELPNYGIVITEKGATNPTSVPVLDCAERAGCSVAFRILNVSDEILSHVEEHRLRLVVVPRHDSDKVVEPFPRVECQFSCIPQVVGQISADQTEDRAGNMVYYLAGSIHFPKIFKAESRTAKFNLSHTPVRVNVVGFLDESSVLFITNVSEGFIMRGKTVELSRPREVATREPAPEITPLLTASLLEDINETIRILLDPTAASAGPGRPSARAHPRAKHEHDPAARKLQADDAGRALAKLISAQSTASLKQQVALRSVGPKGVSQSGVTSSKPSNQEVLPAGISNRVNETLPEAVPRSTAPVSSHPLQRPTAAPNGNSFTTIVDKDLKLGPYSAGNLLALTGPTAARGNAISNHHSESGAAAAANVSMGRPLSTVLSSPSQREGTVVSSVPIPVSSLSYSSLHSSQAMRSVNAIAPQQQQRVLNTPEKNPSKAVHTPSSLLVKSKPVHAAHALDVVGVTGTPRALLSAISQLRNIEDMIQVAHVIANKLGSLPNEGAYAQIIDKARTLDTTILCYAPLLAGGNPVAGFKRSHVLLGESNSSSPQGVHRESSQGNNKAASASKRLHVEEPRILFDTMTS